MSPKYLGRGSYALTVGLLMAHTELHVFYNQLEKVIISDRGAVIDLFTTQLFLLFLCRRAFMLQSIHSMESDAYFFGF